MSADPEVPNLSRKSIFAEVDFVEFIYRKQSMAYMELNFLIRDKIFIEVVNDFAAGIICLEVAAACARSILAKELAIAEFHPVYLPMAIKWVAYRTQLDPVDLRYIQLPRALKEYYDADMRAELTARYDEFYALVPEHQRFGMCWSLQGKDEHNYLEHWKQAFPEAFEKVIMDHGLLAQLASAGYHGVDHVSHIYGAATKAFGTSLPLLNHRLKFSLFADLGGLLAQKLVSLDFRPEAEFPEFFDTEWWLT